MTDRILAIADQGTDLHLANGCITLEDGEEILACIPPEELAAVVISRPHLRVTTGAIVGLVRAGTAMVWCDQRHNPFAFTLGFEGNSTQAERFRAQAGAGAVVRKRLWQAIVRSKIHVQAAHLEERFETDFGLRALARQTRSGDRDATEARAARVYWRHLFGPAFRRDRNAPGLNSILNYGYAVMRALIARAIVASGLHPTLGLQHHNRYDAACLADDLVEPFRVVIDRVAFEITQTLGADVELSKEIRTRVLAAAANSRVHLSNQWRSCSDAAALLSASLADVYCGRRAALVLPDCIR